MQEKTKKSPKVFKESLSKGKTPQLNQSPVTNCKSNSSRYPQKYRKRPQETRNKSASPLHNAQTIPLYKAQKSYKLKNQPQKQ
jgi:hypothetical protein